MYLDYLETLYIMPTSEKIKYYKTWFNDYINQYNNNGKFPENIRIKIAHSLRVYEAISDIAASHGLKGHDLFLAQLSGLFHDIGRFKQYAVYKTFSDSNSVDHAKLGVEVIEENGLFNQLNEHDKQLVTNSIYCHNKISIPVGTDRETLFCKLLRDADKLDIYKVVTENFSADNKNKTLTLDLPDSPLLSSENYNDIMAYKIINKNNLRTRYDFLFLVVSWVFDINFKRTMELIIENKYLDKLFDHLAIIEESKTLKPFILDYLHCHINKKK